MAIVEALLTAEEYGLMADADRSTELYRGTIIEMPPPHPLHGRICFRAAFLIGAFIEARDLGAVFINDTGVVTRRNPDSVRGMDIAYVSFARLPKGSIPKAYFEVAPEMVIEVRSPSDRWSDIHTKVAEYLAIGVLVVCVLDPEPQSAHLSYPDQPNRTLGPDDELTFPECLGDFHVAVRSLFET